MDPRLFEAARTGNVESFRQLRQENPCILADVAFTSTENPLHIASKFGHPNFVSEMMQRRPQFARELDHNGLTPMDMASANGHIDVVREFMRVDQGLCRLQSKEKRTPLHYAAMKGRVEVLIELLSACPESIQDVTTQGETALHLAIKNNQFEAIRNLLQQLEQLNMVDLVKQGDREGNTILHLSASRKQLEIVDLLLRSNNSISQAVDVNATNHRGLTAMDILDILNDGEVELKDTLRHAGAMKTQNVSATPVLSPPQQQADDFNSKGDHYTEWIHYFRYHKWRDPPSETRNALLVVATLIVTITFQVGVNPPGGVWQNNNNGQTAGKAILVSNNSLWIVFLAANSLAFTSSATIISYLTVGFPWTLELGLAVFFMIFTYVTSVDNIYPMTGYQYAIYLVAILAPWLLRRLLRSWWLCRGPRDREKPRRMEMEQP